MILLGHKFLPISLRLPPLLSGGRRGGLCATNLEAERRPGRKLRAAGLGPFPMRIPHFGPPAPHLDLSPQGGRRPDGDRVLFGVFP